MLRPLAWICLIVALTGPALAHAEAADDLARSLVGILDEGQVAPIDGGVGDDPIEVSIGPSGSELCHGQPAWSTPPDLATVLAVEQLRTGPISTYLRLWAESWPYPATTRRHVWLQTFLI